MERGRFSLLLLDPGEIYFEDFSAFTFPSDAATESDFDNNKQIGRLKMCSKSILFDPKDVKKPILRIPLKDCLEISEWKGNETNKFLMNKSILEIKCSQYVEMLVGNILAPYTFKIMNHKFLFLLNYAKLSDCLPQMCQLLRASTLPTADQNSMMAAIVFSRQARVVFDSMWLGDLYESSALETQGNRITPLVVNPGRILLTSARLYFQPFNNAQPDPVLKIDLKDITQVVKRRYLLMHVGLEVFCSGSVRHLYLTLKTSEQRDALYSSLVAQPELRLHPSTQLSMTMQWQNRVISNYDYLLYVNSLADRSFNDLTQYPVFPWVVADYTSTTLDLDDSRTYRDLSKPIGALNPERLQRLKDRCEEMEGPHFLYGSHYSTPAFVLFYLVRKYPHLMLCLQNGRFDHPDRMFNSVSDVWRNVLRNMSDFKELVPEFYDVDQAGSFLVNCQAVNFGHRHDGSKVGDVALPPWARDAEDFTRKLRDALESEYVSTHLHHWIDLIFGYKQRGKEALKANNVFYHMCYEGSVDLCAISDAGQRQAVETQITEFGQIPGQVWAVPHPRRHVASRGARRRPGRAVTFPAAHRTAVMAVAVSRDGGMATSAGRDGQLKVHSTSEDGPRRSVAVSTMPLSACVLLPDEKTVVVGAWDNHITVYHIDLGRVVESFRAHEDAVSCLSYAASSELVASGSWDCSVRLWRSLAAPVRITSALVAQLDHEAHITCLAFTSDGSMLVSGTRDGELFLWSMDTQSLLHQLPGHDGCVNGACFNGDASRLVSCGDDCMFRVLDLNTRVTLYCKTLDQELQCLAWDGSTLLLGGRLGHILVWDLVRVELVTTSAAHDGALLAVALSADGSWLVTGGEDNRVRCWELVNADEPCLL